MARIVGFALLLALCVSGLAMSNETTTLTGPYLGQRPPGEFPRLFAPGIISVPENFEHSAAVFSPDGQEVYWCTTVNWYTDLPREDVSRLFFMRVVDGVWTAPDIAPFTLDFHVGIQRPRFSSDGQRLFFESHRSRVSEHSDTEIYVVEREGDGWSEAVPVSQRINSTAYERLHCVGADGSIYFTRDLMTNREAVYVSRPAEDSFAEPERLGGVFEADTPIFAIAIAPDESYMLIDLDCDVGPDQLYICYREADGTWSERIRTWYSCAGLMALSPDGEYLFFSGEGIYWIDTSFVEELKPDRLLES